MPRTEPPAVRPVGSTHPLSLRLTRKSVASLRCSSGRKEPNPARRIQVQSLSMGQRLSCIHPELESPASADPSPIAAMQQPPIPACSGKTTPHLRLAPPKTPSYIVASTGHGSGRGGPVLLNQSFNVSAMGRAAFRARRSA